MAIKLDTFTVETDTSLASHTSDSGGTYTGAAGQNIDPAVFTVVAADDEVRSGNVNFRYARGSEVPDTPDYWAEVEAKTGATNAVTTNFFAVLVRFAGSSGSITDSTTHAYRARIGGDGSWQLAKIVAGVDTQLQSGAIAGFSHLTYYTLRLEADGTDINVFIDSVQVGTTQSDSDVTAAGRVGLGGQQTNFRITRFEADVVAAVVEALPRRLHIHGVPLTADV